MTQTRDPILEKIKKRRTSAIIAHPDAGKTTLTEKMLLYGGAIHKAGSIKSRKADRHATSDWMDMEQERGISITSSVMQFQYNDIFINLLDTPGHADFSADTYRTLVGADSAVIVIDGTSGIEQQTENLFSFSKKHEIPFVMFINKMDRFGKEPLELVDEIEEAFDVQMVPFTWPIGKGKNFQGVYDRMREQVILYDDTGEHGQEKLETTEFELDDPKLDDRIGADLHETIQEEVELLNMAGAEFDEELFHSGALVPMFFGSAQTNYGVEPFLRHFVEIIPSPEVRTDVDPTQDEFTGYIFKIQANMDPNHRDRIAFLRVGSGVFERGMEAEITRNHESIKLAQPRQFMADDRDVIDTAYPGDVIGLYDSGEFHIGDTISEGSDIEYNRVPRFSPEHFARVKLDDAFKRKHLQQGLDELSEEGAVQVFKPWRQGEGDTIVGVIGELQFDVLEYRLEEEYNVDVRLERLPYKLARWIEGDDIDYKTLDRGSYRMLLEDKDGWPLLLFKSDITLNREKQEHPEIEFHDTAPLHR